MEIMERIEDVEREYTALTAKDNPLWGEEQERELGRLADELKRLYDEAGTDEFDRIAL